MLKEISPGCSLEGLMLNLKFQYFGHVMGRADSLEKTLMLGKVGGRRRRGRQRIRWLNDINDSMDEFGWTPGVGDGQGGLACCSSWGCKVRHDWATEHIHIGFWHFGLHFSFTETALFLISKSKSNFSLITCIEQLFLRNGECYQLSMCIVATI